MLQAGDAARLQPVDQIGQRIDQFAAHRAAQAAVGKLDHAIGRLLHQQMVDGDIAELVDDDGRVGKRRILQQPVEQRRLAGTQKTGEHRNGDRMKVLHGYCTTSPWAATGVPGAGLSGRQVGIGTSAWLFLASIAANAAGTGPVAPPSPTRTRLRSRFISAI